MKNNDWYDLGEQIKDMVQSAVDSQDFRKLNQTVSGVINQAVSSAADSVKKGMEKAEEAFETRSAQYYEKYPNKEIKGDLKKANELEDKLLPLIDACFTEVNPIPVKYGCNLIGLDAGLPRPPLTELEDAHKKIMEECIARLGVKSV